MTDSRFEGVPLRRADFADDRGEADPALAEALSRFGAGDDEARVAVHAALAGARLLVPVVSVLEEMDEPGEDGLAGEKSSYMAMVSMVGAGGKRALLAFSSTDTMRAWDPEARPVPAWGPQVAAAAVQQGEDAVLLDVAGPARLAVTGEDLAALAALAPGDPISAQG